MPKLITHDGTPMTRRVTNALLIAQLDQDNPIIINDHNEYEHNDALDGYDELDDSLVNASRYGEPMYMDSTGVTHFAGDLLLQHDDGTRTPYPYPTPEFPDTITAALTIATWLREIEHDKSTPGSVRTRIARRIMRLAESLQVDTQVHTIYEALDEPL